jgi:hypothetical protein
MFLSAKVASFALHGIPLHRAFFFLVAQPRCQLPWAEAQMNFSPKQAFLGSHRDMFQRG